jgi:peptidoglycan/xylan/chitin deacetylase (PgdA/CDA1 family)
MAAFGVACAFGAAMGLSAVVPLPAQAAPTTQGEVAQSASKSGAAQTSQRAKHAQASKAKKAKKSASTPTFKKPGAKKRAAVITKQATVYVQPSRKAKKRTTAKFAQHFKVSGVSKKWVKVRYGKRYGYVLSSRVLRYNPKKRYIALTFDDGPAYGSRGTKRVVAALKRNHAVATFFIVGSSVHGSTAKAMRAAKRIGCEFGNHSWNHANLATLSKGQVKRQLSRTDKAIARVIGSKPRLVRAPYGSYNRRVLHQLHRPNIFWSVDTLDWKYRNTNRLVRYVTSHAHNGGIVLMHDIHPSTTAAVNRICKKLKKRHFQMVTVSQLAAIHGKTLRKGVTYSRL